MEIESRELELFIENDGELYRKLRKPIEDNLKKHLKRGVFSKEKAMKSYMRLANAGAKYYAKAFAQAEDWNRIFSVSDRKAVAERLLDFFVQEEKI